MLRMYFGLYNLTNQLKPSSRIVIPIKLFFFNRYTFSAPKRNNFHWALDEWSSTMTRVHRRTKPILICTWSTFPRICQHSACTLPIKYPYALFKWSIPMIQRYTLIIHYSLIIIYFISTATATAAAALRHATPSQAKPRHNIHSYNRLYRYVIPFIQLLFYESIYDFFFSSRGLTLFNRTASIFIV